MQKVLIVGQALQLGRTEELYGRGFAALGCQVKHFSWEESDPSLLSGLFLHKVAWRVGWQLLAKSANQALIEMANQFQPDLTFVVSPKLMQPSSIKALKQHGLVFVFFTDNPLDRHHTHSNSWMRRGLPLWDAVFIWSQELAEELHKNAVKKAVFHPFCSDIQYHFPKKQTNPIYDVAFIGNWDASRKREQYLKAIYDCRLGIWGSDYWLTHCQETSLRGFCKGICTYAEIPDVLGASKMGLNIWRPQNEIGHNIRSFEIPATGTLMLSERSREILNIFEEDREAVYFSSPEELNKKVHYFLQNEGLVKTISKLGYEKAIKHTISERISDIAETYANLIVGLRKSATA